MSLLLWSKIAVFGAVIAVAIADPTAGQTLSLERLADIQLERNTTRLRHLLFIAHLRDSAVIAFDTEAERVSDSMRVRLQISATGPPR